MATEKKILTRGSVSALSRGHAYTVHPDGTVDYAGNKIHPIDFKALAEAVLADANFIAAIDAIEDIQKAVGEAGAAEEVKEKPEPLKGSRQGEMRGR